ncbi:MULTISPECIES: flagellar motor switch phosphatase FliY [Bacillus]|uniref:Flagellar motor switch protein FliN n=2 Tax=Bacillus TaxID=1386 RepID=A0A0M5JE78_9BACI|nr:MULTISPECIES: flagellar motor switch phosphatase FliY [Bacillus]ALC81064.1 flagellar motor switch protein FliN [Bacillus gobiensis]MBP1080024.1 flagellar motor switch protein FliN/FliY [Bacillus capparidis]MED1095413.1 flagellar motor switch phosphatase FliY [Bacillus capparidis]
MEHNSLSQDEIDSLLNGTSSLEGYEELSPIEQDAIGEIGNISFGSSATALSTLLNQKVEITTPHVSIVLKSKLNEEFPHPYVAIEVNYTEGFTGSNLLVIKQSDASIIADLMMGGDGNNSDVPLDDIHLSAVQEAMNQMMGSAATSMSTVFKKRVDISPPRLNLLDVNQGEGTETIPGEEKLVKVSFRLTVGKLIDSNIMQVSPITFAKEFINELIEPANNNDDHSSECVSKPEPVLHPENEPKAVHSKPASSLQKEKKSSGQSVSPVEFSAFEDRTHEGTSKTNNLDMLLDIPLSVTVELGKTKKSVKEILELSAGSIIELDTLAGEPVDILVNQRIVAKGEVVVIDENFGVRVTDILSQKERIHKLK